MPTCPYCHKPADDLSVHYSTSPERGGCPNTAFALSSWTPYTGRHGEEPADTSIYRANKPCARPGCPEPRFGKTPYCQEHRREVARASDAKHRDAINARARQRYAAVKSTHYD